MHKTFPRLLSRDLRTLIKISPWKKNGTMLTAGRKSREISRREQKCGKSISRSKIKWDKKKGS